MMNKTDLKRKFIQLLLLFSIPISATSFDLAVVRVAKVPAKALYVTQPEGEENRLFVVNQKGMIHIIENGWLKIKVETSRENYDEDRKKRFILYDEKQRPDVLTPQRPKTANLA